MAAFPTTDAPDVLALFGPTGVGKTAVAIAVARRLRAEGEDPVAISCDALQVYAGLEVLTGAASTAERRELEHRLVGFLPVQQTFSAGQYAELAHREIDALRAEGRRPIVVGGTGLYLRAALAELDLLPPPDPAAREFWQQELENEGAPALHAVLVARDPERAAGIDPNDGRRITRALETAEEMPVGERTQLWTEQTRVPTVLAGLTMAREALYARIDARVAEMVAAGAADEVRAADGAGAAQTARQALGFDELLAGDVERMRANTRRYARRQLTWMRKLAGVEVVDVTDRSPDDVAGEVVALLDS
jgi:tRNA dimethylallyltransferase